MLEEVILVMTKSWAMPVSPAVPTFNGPITSSFASGMVVPIPTIVLVESTFKAFVATVMSPDEVMVVAPDMAPVLAIPLLLALIVPTGLMLRSPDEVATIGVVTDVENVGLLVVFTVRLPVPDKDILVPAVRVKAPCCPPKEVTALVAIFPSVMTFEPA